jgi:hypothetical protein
VGLAIFREANRGNEVFKHGWARIARMGIDMERNFSPRRPGGPISSVQASQAHFYGVFGFSKRTGKKR